MNKLVLACVAASIPTAAPALPFLRDDAATPAGRHPDAALFALIDQFVAADQKYREICATVDRLEAERFPSRALPDVLRWRKSDLKLGMPALYVCEAIPKPNWQAPVYVSPIRGEKWSRWTRVVIKGHPIEGMFYNKCTQYTPSKAARARADEIIAAYDDWAKPGVLPRGFKKLEKEQDRADKIATKLDHRFHETCSIVPGFN